MLAAAILNQRIASILNANRLPDTCSEFETDPVDKQEVRIAFDTEANEFETDPVDEQVEVRHFAESQRDETARDLQSIFNKKHFTRRFAD